MADFSLTFAPEFARALSRLAHRAISGDGLRNLLTTLSNSMVQATGHTHDTEAVGEGGALDGSAFADVADLQTAPGAMVIYSIPIAAGALGNTDVLVDLAIRVIDAWLVLTGAGVATTTLQVFNGATNITDAMAASGSDEDLVRAAAIGNDGHDLADGGTLRVTSATGATQPDAIVYVMGYRIP